MNLIRGAQPENTAFYRAVLPKALGRLEAAEGYLANVRRLLQRPLPGPITLLVDPTP